MKYENIAQRLNIELSEARTIKSIIIGNIDPLSTASKWSDQCYKMPSELELKLEAINSILGGFGVEYIESVDDTYTELFGLSYINLGDTYINTVVFDHSTNKWHYTSYGDLVEADLDNYI